MSLLINTYDRRPRITLLQLYEYTLRAFSGRNTRQLRCLDEFNWDESTGGISQCQLRQMIGVTACRKHSQLGV